MTTIVRAKMWDGSMKEIEAVFPAELDPRFDFVKSNHAVTRAHLSRLVFLRKMEPAAVSFKIKTVDDRREVTIDDLDFVSQPRMNGSENFDSESERG
jgi:hypothetical protein